MDMSKKTPNYELIAGTTRNYLKEQQDRIDQIGDHWGKIQTVGYESPITDETDIRWAVNVLLEKIAAKFEANETMDIWRSDAAALVRSFKHQLP